MHAKCRALGDLLTSGLRRRRSPVSRSARPGEAAVRVSWRFEVLVEFSARSHREDVVWSGRNAEGSPVFAFLVKLSVVARHLFRNASLVGYPRFFVSEARVFVVLGVCPGTCVVPLRSVSSVLDTLTPVFELYVQLRERQQ
ncbi:hypothetical protein Taro_046214 [Colocasia esculenta]|uniref:Uncharacterized protein n=1 Tax=Colocasia esculenta TaxID=4460 RepID=A0A843X1T3_COLES|nr:hypothetical protein [Colocasia esculenta]